jgi:hypothetical protein
VAQRISFYMDQHVPSAVTAGLRRRGVNVLTAQEAGMCPARDDQHFVLALEQNRVIFTQDADFLRLHAAGIEHPGIAYAPQGTSVSAIIRGLMLICEMLDPGEMTNHVEFI